MFQYFYFLVLPNFVSPRATFYSFYICTSFDSLFLQDDLLQTSESINILKLLCVRLSQIPNDFNYSECTLVQTYCRTLVEILTTNSRGYVKLKEVSLKLLGLSQCEPYDTPRKLMKCEPYHVFRVAKVLMVFAVFFANMIVGFAKKTARMIIGFAKKKLRG